MAGRIDARLKELGLELPEPPKAVANYVPWRVSGDQVFISGQISAGYTGKVPDAVSPEDAYKAARVSGLSLIAQLRTACEGDLDRVTGVIRLGGFVNCQPDFAEIPQIINGASDLMVEIFDDPGRHARAAVGAVNLPLNAAVEVEGVFEIR